MYLLLIIYIVIFSYLSLYLFVAVLSGKELFNYNAALFVDDDGALDEKDEQEMNADMVQRKLAEEQKAREEEERIQAEQQRLFELQQIEFEARRHKEAERRLAAAAPGRATFILAGVEVNQVVFEDDEEEDLHVFSEEMLVEAEAREEGQYATEAMKEAYLQVSDDDGEAMEEDDEGEEGSEGDEDSEDEGDDEGEEGDTGNDGDQS